MLQDELVRVYYEDDTASLYVATFDSEYLYVLCLPILENDAKTKGYTRVVESVVDASDKHGELRNILIKYNSPEFGDSIVDDICRLFDYPTTIDMTPEEEK